MTQSWEFEDRDWELDDHDWSHKAWMSATDADLFESVLLRQAESRSPLEVLEWGSGRSTLYYTRLLAERGVNFRWLSLEYDRAYFHAELEPRISELADARVHYVDDAASRTLRLDEAPPAAPRVELVVFDKHRLLPMLSAHKDDRLADLDAYVDFPAAQGRRFDVVLVDGRKRRRCLRRAAELLAPGGVALLHDAWRPYYHCAFDAYRSQRQAGDILWAGTQEDESHLDALLAASITTH